MLVEDDPDIRAVARMSLRRAGFEVMTVDCGERLIAQAADAAPDVVLLDWILPGMDGLETLTALRANPRTASIPVIFLTGRTEPDAIERAIASGAIGCLPKPFNALTLGTEVMRMFTEWTAHV